MTVHFICRGNAFRSIIAEAYLNSLQIPGIKVISSGTVASEFKEKNAVNYPKTMALLKKRGIEQFAKGHYADDVKKESLDTSNVIIFMNKRAYDEAAASFDLPQNFKYGRWPT